MIVDNLKSCYTTTMRVRSDPELIVPVRWYWAPPGAQPLPIETAFGSSVWETNDREYPQPGLGEVDLTKTWSNGLAPPGVTGQSTPTPLEWFRSGIPADVVYPPPNPGVSAVIDLKKVVECVDGNPATITTEAAVATLKEELALIRQWRFLLFRWPPTLGPALGFADLQEAAFPGYARQTPGWTDAVAASSTQATTFASTLTWTRAAGGAPPETIFGWAAVGTELPVRLRSLQLLPVPITLTNPGDNVTLCPLQLLLGLCPPAALMPTLRVCPDALGPQWYAYRGTVTSFSGSDYTNSANGAFRWTHVAGCLWRAWYPPVGLPPGAQASWDLVFTSGGGASIALWSSSNFVLARYDAPAPVDPAGPITFFPAYLHPDVGTHPLSITLYGVPESMPLIGEIIEYGGDDTPALFLEADGSAVSRATFALLFAVFGTRYGAGDGSTTFNLPDRRDRVGIGTSPGGLAGRPTARVIATNGGEETHQLIPAEVATHAHTVTDPGHQHLEQLGAAFVTSEVGTPEYVHTGADKGQLSGFTANAMTHLTVNPSSPGDAPHNNMQPFLVSRFLVYAGA